MISTIKNTVSEEVRTNSMAILLALFPAFLMSLLSLLFVMFEIRIGSYVEAIWQLFVFASLGAYLVQIYMVSQGKYDALDARRIFTRAAFLILVLQCYLGFYGIMHLFEDQHVMDEVLWGAQFYGFAIFGAMIWVIRKLTVLIETPSGS